MIIEEAIHLILGESLGESFIHLTDIILHLEITELVIILTAGMILILMVGGIEMKYTACFGIDGGISPGFGVKYPDYAEEVREFEADSYDSARMSALKIAARSAKDHLSNPKTGYTTVKILSLMDKDDNIVSQEPLLERVKDLEFENGCAVVKCSMEMHLLILALEQSNKKEN